jgi:cadmium resistance protein CadD (predicted permease)
MNPTTVVQAAAMFIATNIDDLVVLAVFFGRARGDRSATLRVVIGQYAGFIAILAVSVAGAMGARLLPDSVIPYFGLVPLLLGMRAAWVAWRQRDDDGDDWEVGGRPGVGTATVAVVTFAHGGDNLGVYVPVFTAAGPSGLSAYMTVFLIGVGLWCLLSRRIAAHPAVAVVLQRWEHIVLPIVLIGVGLAILAQGGVFSL